MGKIENLVTFDFESLKLFRQSFSFIIKVNSNSSFLSVTKPPHPQLRFQPFVTFLRNFIVFSADHVLLILELVSYAISFCLVSRLLTLSALLIMQTLIMLSDKMRKILLSYCRTSINKTPQLHVLYFSAHYPHCVCRKCFTASLLSPREHSKCCSIGLFMVGTCCVCKFHSNEI